MALFGRPKREPTPYAIVDRGVVIELTTEQRDKLLEAKLIVPDDDTVETGYYWLESNVPLSAIDFAL